jgi:hypothetical protein
MILWHGACGFTSALKEGVLHVFIALKNSLPRLGLNSRTLGQMLSTLTTTQPRQLKNYIVFKYIKLATNIHEKYNFFPPKGFI